MEEGNNPPHSMGSGKPHQNPVHHARPFFYVQPAPQPYYMYQWHMYNPYGQFGFPGTGLHFGRPYVSAIPYMQYPGYIIPHAPMHPVEYRRMFNPYAPPAAAYGLSFCHNQSRMRRETVCSEAQTEPSAAVNKLLDSLGKVGVREAVNPEKQLDSGADSQRAGICFPEDGQKPNRQVPMTTKPPSAPLQSPIMLLSDSTGAAQDVESRRSGLKKPAQQEEWSVTSDGVLPLNGSSICEDVVLLKATESTELCTSQTDLPAVQVDCDQSLGIHDQIGCGVNAPPDHVVLPSTIQGCEEPHKPSAEPMRPLSECSPSQLSSSWPDEDAVLLGRAKTTKVVAPLSGTSGEAGVADFEDLPYRILRLPYNKVMPVGLLEEDNPLWCVDQLTTFIPPPSYMSSFNNAYYSYYPQTAQERQSVLSPSLDELSSRDEIFSTDVEDMDLLPSQVYMAGGMLADGARSIQEPSRELVLLSSSEEECSVCSRNTCATCGSTLSKTKRSKVRSPEDYSQKGDADEEGSDAEKDVAASPVGLVQAHLRHVQTRGRQASKQKLKHHYGDPEDPAFCVGAEQECVSLGAFCKEHIVKAGVEKFKGQEARCIQSTPHLEGQWEEGAVASDRESWESCSVKGRPKTWKRYSSHGQGMAAAHQPLGSAVHGLQAPSGIPDPPGVPHLGLGSCPAHLENNPPHRSRPFFYVQPPQSYVPYQWPMPITYNPYCHLPGFGYGMVMPPNLYGFQPNPYMEAPGYIMPHAQLHLADYRRMLNPHFSPAMAYHARRFRCQHLVVPREMTTTEVQTEPLAEDRNDSQMSGPSESSTVEARSKDSDSAMASGCTSASSSRGSESSTRHGKAECVDVDGGMICTLPQASATPKGAYMFQRDPVQMGADRSLCTMNFLSCESAAKSTPDASGLQVQYDSCPGYDNGAAPLNCSPAHQVSSVQEVVFDAGRPELQCAPSYPDILLVGGSPPNGPEAGHNDKYEPLAEQKTMDKVTDLVRVGQDMSEDMGGLKGACFKILRLPFEVRYLEELQKVEESVWSLEPLVPCTPPMEWMVQHEVMEAEVAKKLDQALEGPSVNQQPTSPLETMSPYLPSASWLADFGNVYYYSKLPPSVQAHLNNFSSSVEPPAVKEKLSKGHSVFQGVREKCSHVKRMDGKGRLHLKDHLGKSLHENRFSSVAKGERNCPRCLTKLKIPPGLNPKPLSKRPRVPLSPGHPKSQTHISCRCCVGNVLRKGLSPDVSLWSKDEETENSAPLNPQWPGGETKMPVETGVLTPSRRHAEKCSVKGSKLQEKNCACKVHSRPRVHDRYEWRNKEDEENLAVSTIALEKCKTQEQRLAELNRQTDSSWKGMLMSKCENGTRLRTLSKLKRCTLSQEKHLNGTPAQKEHRSGPVEGCFSPLSRTKTGSRT